MAAGLTVTPAQTLPASSSPSSQATSLEVAALAARTGRVVRWMRVRLGDYNFYKECEVDLVSEPVVAYTPFSDRIVPRDAGFFLDHIIAHALLGTCRVQGTDRWLYPPLSTAREFQQRGYTLDPPAIAKEARNLLFRRTVDALRN